ncbi:MAG: HEAT repeat domain-containing protein [Bacteroidales bacterium]|nr:HEAT repeat domain-containing protein [Bacteroidales bacterium]
MKRKLIILSASLLTLLILGFLAIYIWIDFDVKKNINNAREKYPGSAEDALIAYLLDTTNSPQDRSSVAIWTLGQIHSKKAIPILKKLYKHDPEGKTCYGKHDSVLCQYEIYKAIKAEESNWWPLHSRLNK